MIGELKDKSAAPAPALELRNVTGGYGSTTVLRNVDVVVERGSIHGILGPNGAGKTTLMRVAAGLLAPASGSVLVGGVDVTAQPAWRVSRMGACLIPEGRGVFRALTVRENLMLQTPRGTRRDVIEPALDAFPILKDRLGQLAGTLSGGQQQMLAISRSFLASPDVVMLDEVSMGLAPVIVDEIFEALMRLSSQGKAMLVVEQYVHKALQVVDTVTVLNRGSITFSGPTPELDEEVLMQGYLG